MIGITAAFWISLLAIAYAYVGYPAVLWLLWRSRLFHGEKGSEVGSSLPSVTMIISAFNEEKVIGDKINNTLLLDYPHDLLEIVVASDGSDDCTCDIVLEFADKGVILRHYEGRIGKTACLNQAVPLAKGGIVVFSDANSLYEKRALRALVQPFTDPTVGFVTGWTKYGLAEDVSSVDSLGLYSRLESITKDLESRLGSCIGADGAIFAIRKALYSPLKDYDINDMVIPLSINERGYRGVLDTRAVCFEKDAGGTKGEFHRQVRITSRTIRAIMNYRHLLNPFRFGFLSFELLSHKICKFLVPGFLLIVLASNVFLVERGGFFVAMLVAQGIFYFLAGAISIAPEGTVLFRVINATRTFVLVNVAIALAWLRYFQGKTYTTWFPTKR